MSVSPSSHKRKARDSNPHHHVVARISSAARQTVSGYLPYVSGPDGNRTHHTDFARVSRLPWYMPARLSEVRGGNRTRSPSLPRTCAARTPTDLLGCLRHNSNGYRHVSVESREGATSTQRVIPGRIELPLSWVSSRRLRHWTTGSCQ